MYNLVNRTNLMHKFLLFSTCFRQLCAHHQEKITITMRPLVFVTLYRWPSGMRAGPAHIPDSHLYRVTNTRCRMVMVIFSWWWAIVARNMYRKAINILKQIVHQVGSIHKSTKYYAICAWNLLFFYWNDTVELGNILLTSVVSFVRMITCFVRCN